jgi:transposase-like protein
MTIHFSVGKLKREEREAILQEVQQQAKVAARAAVKAVLEALLEAEVSAKLGREKGMVRRVSSQPREIDWQCGHCGCRDAHQMLRDGHYRRSLQTSWGPIEDLAVPMLECQCCGHDVVCHFAVFDKYERFWFDLDQDVLLGSGLCESLRHLSERWSEMVGSSVGLQTLNKRINQILALVEQAQQGPITEVPTVVQFDGIWLRYQQPTGKTKRDRRGRERELRAGKKVVLLVALGLWTDGSGKRAILDWEVAEAESQADWQRLLDRLEERGLRPEAGLQAIIRDGKGELGAAVAQVYGGLVLDQRCIFHKLRNVADKAREDLGGEAHRQTRQELLKQAAAIYEAPDAAQARERLASFVSHWQEQAPKAVSTLQRDFETTIAYYRLPEMARELVRTTSLLERANRELRRKFRQACCFSSRQGAQVAIFLQVQRFNARWAKQSWAHTAHTLYFAFAKLDP